MDKHQIGRRLLKYAMVQRWSITAALILLTAAVCTELVGPFIGKQIIDTNILGIEKPWYETGQKVNEYSVTYNGNYYLREDRVDPSEQLNVIGLNIIMELKLHLVQMHIQ